MKLTPNLAMSVLAFGLIGCAVDKEEQPAAEADAPEFVAPSRTNPNAGVQNQDDDSEWKSTFESLEKEMEAQQKQQKEAFEKQQESFDQALEEIRAANTNASPQTPSLYDDNGELSPQMMAGILMALQQSDMMEKVMEGVLQEEGVETKNSKEDEEIQEYKDELKKNLREGLSRHLDSAPRSNYVETPGGSADEQALEDYKEQQKLELSRVADAVLAGPGSSEDAAEEVSDQVDAAIEVIDSLTAEDYVPLILQSAGNAGSGDNQNQDQPHQWEELDDETKKAIFRGIL